MYVISRLDLPDPHRSVQIGHGVLAATNTFGEPDATHPNLVVCAVKDEKELTSAFELLKRKGVRCCAWYEPDLGDQLTAVTTAPLRGVERNPLGGFRLLR